MTAGFTDSRLDGLTFEAVSSQATASYQNISHSIGQQRACRAIGTRENPISLLIPCHSIVYSSGKIANYRWRLDRKLALLEAEHDNSSIPLQSFH
jgi:AraC family transcriptional regulator of adaptative response/methylated-DNA-[protein]-cysteine methyltransferase